MYVMHVLNYDVFREQSKHEKIVSKCPIVPEDKVGEV